MEGIIKTGRIGKLRQPTVSASPLTKSRTPRRQVVRNPKGGIVVKTASPPHRQPQHQHLPPRQRPQVGGNFEISISNERAIQNQRYSPTRSNYGGNSYPSAVMDMYPSDAGNSRHQSAFPRPDLQPYRPPSVVQGFYNSLTTTVPPTSHYPNDRYGGGESVVPLSDRFAAAASHHRNDHSSAHHRQVISRDNHHGGSGNPNNIHIQRHGHDHISPSASRYHHHSSPHIRKP